MSSLALSCLQTVRDWTLHLLLETGNKCILAVCHISSHVFLDMFLAVVGHASGGTALLCDHIHWSCPCVLVILQIHIWEGFGILWKKGSEAWSEGEIWPAESEFLTPELWHHFLLRQWPLEVSIVWVNVSVYFHYKWYQQIFSTWRTAPLNECSQTRKAKVFM